ncbi:hypothetical protein PIB30_049229 [Stylosanthes scabra]|uniref:Uncharacterized protein n=1 Tax=Stylosanthes scabra TaxID=79078 RepID=A0ABU6QGP3_9FABA|nr:hypothetical protein [Stylosanthes scabra]
MKVDMATKKQKAQPTAERKMTNSSEAVEGKFDSTKETRNDKKKSLIPAMTLDEFFEEYGVEPIDENDEEYDDPCEDQDPSTQDKETGTTKKETRAPLSS